MKSFLSGRPQAGDSPLQPMSSPSPGESGARLIGHRHLSAKGGTNPGLGPTIECVKQGDKVARIIVTCPCGERIEIECLYPAGG